MCCICCYFEEQEPYSYLRFLIVEVSSSHSDTPHWVGLLWTRDRSVTETSDNTQLSQETYIHAPGGIQTRSNSKRATIDLDVVFVTL